MTLDNTEKKEVKEILEAEDLKERSIPTWPAIMTLIIAMFAIFIGTVYSFHNGAKSDLQKAIDQKVDKETYKADMGRIVGDAERRSPFSITRIGGSNWL